MKTGRSEGSFRLGRERDVWLADVKARDVEFHPATGEAVRKVVERTVAAAPDPVARTRLAIE